MSRFTKGIIIGVALMISCTAFAAPIIQNFNNIAPFANDTYDLGTTTPSQEWLHTYTKILCLSGDCRSVWPKSGLSTTSPLSSSNLLVYSSAGAGSATGVATTSVTCSGTVSCSGFNVLGSSPITITGSGGSGSSYPFPLTGNATTTLTNFLGGIGATTIQATSTATSTIGNLGGVLNPQVFSGADIGAQINTAIAGAPSYGTAINVPSPTSGTGWSFSTPIVAGNNNQPVRVMCAFGGGASGKNNGIVLQYTGTTGTALTFNTNNYVTSSGSGLVGCDLQGTNGTTARSTIGVYFNGSNGGFNGYLDGATVSGMGTGVELGTNTSFDTVENSVVNFNGQNFSEPNTSGANCENIRAINDVFADANNQNGGATALKGTYIQQSGNCQFNAGFNSFDDNQIYLDQFGGTANITTLTNDHFEDPNGTAYPMIGENTGATNIVLNLVGSDLMNDDTSGQPDQIEATGNVNLLGVVSESNDNVSVPVIRIVNALASSTEIVWAGLTCKGANVDSYVYGTVGCSPFGVGSDYGQPSLYVATTTSSTPGFVGIATSSPTTALSVKGVGYFTGGIKFGDGTTQTTAATGGGGSPGGSNGQIQYNNSSAFGGSATTITSAGTINIPNGQTYQSGGTNVIQAFPSQNSYFFGNAGNATTIGTFNLGFGDNALGSVAGGAANVAVGAFAAPFLGGGSNNLALGFNALQLITGGSDNVGIGYQSGNTNDSANDNVSIGSKALYTNLAGNGNVGIGFQAGYSLTGSANIILGQNIEAPVAANSGQLNIGNVLYGTGLYNNTGTKSSSPTGGSIGIGTTTPMAILSIQGNQYTSGSAFFGGAITATSTVTLSGLTTGTGNGAICATSGGLIEYSAGANCVAGGGSTTGLATTSPVASSNLLEYSSVGAGSAFGVATTSATINNGLTGTLTTINSQTQTIGLATIAQGVMSNTGSASAVPTSNATSTLFTGSTGQVPYFSASGALVGTSTISISTAQLTTLSTGETVTAGNLNVQGGTINVAGAVVITNGKIVEAVGGTSANTPDFTFSGATTNGLYLIGTTGVGISGSGTAIASFISGNEGVGSSTPFSKLSVSTAAQQSGTLPLFTIASTTNAVLMTMLGNGKFGIGTSTPTTNFVSVAASTTAGTTQTAYNGVAAIFAGLENTVAMLFLVIDQWGHQITQGDTPTVSGGTSTIVAKSTDNSGQINVAGTALTSVTLTFAHPWPNAPNCTESDNQTAITGDVSSVSATQVVFGFGTGGVTTAQLWYVCQGNQ